MESLFYERKTVIKDRRLPSFYDQITKCRSTFPGLIYNVFLASCILCLLRGIIYNFSLNCQRKISVFVEAKRLEAKNEKHIVDQVLDYDL